MLLRTKDVDIVSVEREDDTVALLLALPGVDEGPDDDDDLVNVADSDENESDPTEAEDGVVMALGGCDDCDIMVDGAMAAEVANVEVEEATLEGVTERADETELLEGTDIVVIVMLGDTDNTFELLDELTVLTCDCRTFPVPVKDIRFELPDALLLAAEDGAALAVRPIRIAASTPDKGNWS